MTRMGAAAQGQILLTIENSLTATERASWWNQILHKNPKICAIPPSCNGKSNIEQNKLILIPMK